jgi:hypothetical protein
MEAHMKKFKAAKVRILEKMKRNLILTKEVTHPEYGLEAYIRLKTGVEYRINFDEEGDLIGMALEGIPPMPVSVTKGRRVYDVLAKPPVAPASVAPLEKSFTDIVFKIYGKKVYFEDESARFVPVKIEEDEWCEDCNEPWFGECSCDHKCLECGDNDRYNCKCRCDSDEPLWKK